MKQDTRFKKGEGGRPKGVQNKLTRQTKERIEWVLNLLDETLEVDLLKLRASERVRLWIDLQEYVRPKLQRVNLDLTPQDKGVQKVTFEIVRSQETGEMTEGLRDLERGRGEW